MTRIIKLVENIFFNGPDNFKTRNPNTFVCFCCGETKKELLTVMGALYGATWSKLLTVMVALNGATLFLGISNSSVIRL